ncbi:MAG: hypothetical protein GY847_24955 [Proteobacteria bacterium]|nr:hypothetical protein [Pseudomonadota bacterium]
MRNNKGPVGARRAVPLHQKGWMDRHSENGDLLLRKPLCHASRSWNPELA